MDNRALSINIKGKLFSLATPRVMGIINITPDSFHSRSRAEAIDDVVRMATSMRADGANIIDIGGCSTRPGSQPPSADEEMRRLAIGLEGVRRAWPEAVISVDTFRAGIARRCVEDFEADIINDVAGGTLDPEMWPTIATLKVPYILMHMRGTPATMQQLTDYEDVTADVMLDLVRKAAELHALGVADVILDPGFGFAKTTEQNFQLLAELSAFRRTGMPVLAGISRKGMIWKTLGITPAEALPGTTVLNTAALLNGADIIRVHDVKEAAQAVKLVTALRSSTPTLPHQ